MIWRSLGDPELDEISRRTSWTIRMWRYGLKLGPITLIFYRIDAVRRLSICFDQYEYWVLELNRWAFQLHKGPTI